MNLYKKNISKEPLKCNERYFANHIVAIVYRYPVFGLTKVRCKNSNEEFIVDSKLLTELPDDTYTLSIGLLEGGLT